MNRKSVVSIDLEVCLGRCLLDEELIGKVQEILLRYAVGWVPVMRLWPPEHGDKNLDLGADRSLFDLTKREIEEAAANTGSRLTGLVEFRGATQGLAVIMSVDEKTFFRVGDNWLWGNRIALQIRKQKIGSINSVKWAGSVFEELCAAVSPWYGRASSTQEYEAKNIDRSDGVRAVGVNVARALPGLYWLNFFGKPYVDHIGREQILSAPAETVRAIDDGILLRLMEYPGTWDSAEYRLGEEKVLEHLSPRYFFSKTNPARIHSAPSFDLVGYCG